MERKRRERRKKGRKNENSPSTDRSKISRRYSIGRSRDALEAGSRSQWTRYDTRAIIHADVGWIRLTATLIYSRSCLSRAATRVRHGDR